MESDQHRRQAEAEGPQQPGCQDEREITGHQGGELVALTPGIERVVHRTLQPDLLVVGLAVQQGEAPGDGAQSGGLWCDTDVGAYVGSVDDAGQLGEGRVFQVVLEHDRLEAASPVDMTEFDVGHVVWNRVFPFGGRHDLAGGNEQEFCLRIHEPFDQPRTRDSIDVGIGASDPLHKPEYGLAPPDRQPITLTLEEGWLWRRPSPWRPTVSASDIRPACSRSTTSIFGSGPGKCTASSGRTAPARPRPCGYCPGCFIRPPGLRWSRAPPQGVPPASPAWVRWSRRLPFTRTFRDATTCGWWRAIRAFPNRASSRSSNWST